MPAEITSALLSVIPKAPGPVTCNCSVYTVQLGVDPPRMVPLKLKYVALRGGDVFVG